MFAAQFARVPARRRPRRSAHRGGCAAVRGRRAPPGRGSFPRAMRPEVDHRQVVFAQAPRLAQRRVAARGIELLAYRPRARSRTTFAEAAAPAGNPRSSRVGTSVASAPLWKRRIQRSAVLLQEGHAVIAHVLVEAGVEAGGGGNAQLARRAQRRPAQRAFGGDVDRIRPRVGPAARAGVRGRRQAEFQARIARQARAAHQQVSCGGSRLPGRTAAAAPASLRGRARAGPAPGPARSGRRR